ncbi:hypothetical protein [Agromyces sp. NPDC058104]|uniref:hypothetical protein n=1 Tax=Agromyces sp. NPDC058104 TaxID=3346342 RepID=UPI0036DCF017
MRTSIGVVSYCDHIRTLAAVNHELYAARHGYVYLHDIAPTRERRFKAKIEKIRKLLPLFDWVFWIDDDAYFMQPEVPLEGLIDLAPGAEVIFCESPVNEGKWTWISSGNFFIRNSHESMRLLDAVLSTDLSTVAEWWDPSTYGYYTKGDQDALVYHLATDERFSSPGFLARLHFERFNTRPFHFIESSDEYFLVHFTGGDKHRQATEFGDRFGLTPALVPVNELGRLAGIYHPPKSTPVGPPADAVPDAPLDEPASRPNRSASFLRRLRGGSTSIGREAP